LTSVDTVLRQKLHAIHNYIIVRSRRQQRSFASTRSGHDDACADVPLRNYTLTHSRRCYS